MPAPRSGRRRHVETLLAVALLAGCGAPTLVSQHLDSTAKVGGERGGMVYALPMTVLSIERKVDAAKNATYEIKPAIMPDGTARYRLRYAAFAAVDDDVKVEVDDNLLLKSGSADVTDQTPAIIIAAAKLARIVARGFLPFAKPGEATTTACSAEPFTEIVTLDQLRAGKVLPDCSRISMVLPDPTAPPPAGPAPTEPTDCNFSLCFRSTMTVIARITSVRDDMKQSHHDFAFVAVDPTYTEGIDLRGAPLVHRVNTAGFRNGLLVSNQVVKPSSALAAANLPLDVIKAVLAAPTELLTLRTQAITGESGLLDAKANLIAKQSALIQAQQQFNEAQAKAKAAAGGVAGTGGAP